jgi:predicted phosphoribosyltransferase
VIHLPFTDRFEAGHLLGEELAARQLPENTIVLGLPRGGVPVAFAVATMLKAPLDVVAVRKLSVPGQPELAMGAIAGGRIRILDHSVIEDLGISAAEVEAVETRETEELERRQRRYRHGRAAPDLLDWTVIVVDDGFATGSSMVVALDYVYSFRPAKVIAAAPVGSAAAYRKLQRIADDCVCLATPEPFCGIGAWYADFAPVRDFEVQRLLEQRRREAGPICPAGWKELCNFSK